MRDMNSLIPDMHRAIEMEDIQYVVGRIIKDGVFEVDGGRIEAENRHDPENAQVILRRNDGSTVFLMDVGRSLELDFNGVAQRAEYAPSVTNAAGDLIDAEPTAGLNRIQYLVLQHANNIVRGN